MPIDPVTGSLIGIGVAAAGSLGGNALTNAGARRRQTHAAMLNATQWNIEQQRFDELWHRQNAYNSPQAQMQRFAEAGLNPHLIYGKGSPGNATSAGTSEIEGVKPANYAIDNPVAHMAQYADWSVKAAQVDNLRTQSIVNTQEALLKTADRALKDYKLSTDKNKEKRASDLHNYAVEAAKANVELIQNKAFAQELANNIQDATQHQQITEIAYRLKAAKETYKGKKLENELKELRLELEKLGIRPEDAWFYRTVGKWLFEGDQNPLERMNEWLNQYIYPEGSLR